jgi:hypothetical protein
MNLKATSMLTYQTYTSQYMVLPRWCDLSLEAELQEKYMESII